MRLGVIITTPDILMVSEDYIMDIMFKDIHFVEIKYGFDSCVIKARSKHFDNVNDGDEIPLYLIEFSFNSDTNKPKRAIKKI